MSRRPPAIARWLLTSILPGRDRSFVLADLDQEFEQWAGDRGVQWARRHYWDECARSLMPSFRDRVRRLRHGLRHPTARRGNFMAHFSRDLRFAARSFRKQPTFTAVALLTLALGIGANAAIFSVLQGTLLAPLPYAEPDRVVGLGVGWTEGASGRPATALGHGLSEPEYFDFVERVTGFTSVAAYTDVPVNVTGDLDPERVDAGLVTGNTFALLGVDAVVGRTFLPEEDEPGASGATMLSYDYWVSRFGADPDVVGRDLVVNGNAAPIVGVLPQSFELPHNLQDRVQPQLWATLRLDRQNLSGRGSHYLYSIARLAPGTTLDQVNGELQAVGRALVDEGLYRPESEFTAGAISVRALVFGDVAPILLVLFGAVGFVLLIACANVANLLLARAEARRQELAVRTAVGAGRGQLIRQLLAESTLLALMGGVLGIGIAAVGTKALIALEPGNVPRLGEVGLNLGVLGYALAISLGTGVLFGTVPALLSSKSDLQSALKVGPRSGGAQSGRRFQHGLVAVQMGFAVLLAIGATLTLRSFSNLLQIDPGFQSDRTVAFQVALSPQRYDTPQKMIDFYAQLTADAAELPGVEAVGAVRSLPLAQSIGDWSISIEGRERQPGEDFDGDWQIVTAGYLETLRIPLLEGRVFDASDRTDAPPAMVINEAMAQRYWPGESAIGKRIQLGTAMTRPWITIVGVVGNVRHNGITGEINSKWYLPHSQFGQVGGGVRRAMNIVIRTTGDPLATLSAARQLVRDRDPSLPIANVQTMEEVMGASVAGERFAMMLLLVFGGVALFLAAVGVYGVLSFAVSQRTHEIGLRMALGATGKGVVRLIVRQGMMIALLGLAGGTVAALFLTNSLTTLLYEVSTRDAVTFAIVPAVLGVVALLASFVPAARAVHVDPMIALRID